MRLQWFGLCNECTGNLDNGCDILASNAIRCSLITINVGDAGTSAAMVVFANRKSFPLLCTFKLLTVLLRPKRTAAAPDPEVLRSLEARLAAHGESSTAGAAEQS